MSETPLNCWIKHLTSSKYLNIWPKLRNPFPQWFKRASSTLFSCVSTNTSAAPRQMNSERSSPRLQTKHKASYFLSCQAPQHLSHPLPSTGSSVVQQNYVETSEAHSLTHLYLSFPSLHYSLAPLISPLHFCKVQNMSPITLDRDLDVLM